jgi:hypothetical protein
MFWIGVSGALFAALAFQWLYIIRIRCLAAERIKVGNEQMEEATAQVQAAMKAMRQ